jgi:hypothetical protein
MAGLRLPGPLNLLGLDGLSGVLQLYVANPPGPTGTSPDAAQPAHANRPQPCRHGFWKPLAERVNEPSPSLIGN